MTSEHGRRPDPESDPRREEATRYEGESMGITEPREDDWFGDDREIGWGDEALSDDDDGDIERLLADLPPHHVEH
jgi:hypothetical protein